MTGLMRHEIAWVAAAPLWKQAVKSPEVLRRPTLLGFGHDGFMDELLAMLAQKPEQIAERVATGPSRSYRERRPGETYDAKPTVESGRLKLYQPVHGWFYLVAGSLVCQLPGLPDKGVDLASGESAGFVVRRLRGKDELALTADAAGKKAWQAAPRDALAGGEEVLPMFPLAFREADRRRRLLAGVIPTGSQDLFLAAPVAGEPAPAEGKPPPAAEALEAVQARVVNAIRVLQAAPPPPPAPQPTQDQQREISRFVLLDLADFLVFYLPAVMDNLRHGTALTGKAKALAQLLRTRSADPTVDTKTLGDLLGDILATDLSAAFKYNLANASSAIAGELETALQGALEEARPGELDDTSTPTRIQDTQYVTRLVYRRPHCPQQMAEVLSPPSEAFLLAPYFDPEAPARPIRIALPFDPSVKGLRQFRKNVRMVLSEALRQKTATKKINDKIDGPDLACGAFELSIPIITIVAMIILFVFINLLNLIFWWIPFVKICLPNVKVEA